MKVAKRQERRGSRTRVAGLSDIIMRLGGRPPLALWRGEAHKTKRESLDKVLNKIGKKHDAGGGVGLEKRKSSKYNKEEDKEKEDKEDDKEEIKDKEEDEDAARNKGSLKRSRGVETSFNSKRMRPNSANVFRQDVKVKI